MFSWANLALAIIELLTSLFRWFREGQLREQGNLKETLDDVVIAKKEREDARSRNNDVPESDSLPDDGFQRRD